MTIISIKTICKSATHANSDNILCICDTEPSSSFLWSSNVKKKLMGDIGIEWIIVWKWNFINKRSKQMKLHKHCFSLYRK